MSTASGDGVGYSNITISNWKGTESNGLQRGPIKVLCPAGNPCYDLTIEDFAMWTESGDSQTYTCSNAYGEGFCLAGGDDHVAYTATPTTVTVAPSGYSAATMAADLTAAFGTASSIPIPTIPTTFFPGVTPYSALASASAAATASFASSATSAGDVLAVSSLIVIPTGTFSATSTATTTVSPVAASVASASSVVSSTSTSIFSPSPETSSASATVGVISSISMPFASGSAAVSYTSFLTSVVSSTQSAPSETSSTRVPELEETEGCPSGFEHESHAHDHVQDHGHGHLHRRRFGRH
ncbi:hypothetical protein EIK77_008126 [Talaromyces pinophilus]|nr:hypothetical protein EIK77_008126 [Talaromyces pinophilus]